MLYRYDGPEGMIHPGTILDLDEQHFYKNGRMWAVNIDAISKRSVAHNHDADTWLELRFLKREVDCLDFFNAL